jgi:predicted anti-sigma-YlaC factor YlaD
MKCTDFEEAIYLYLELSEEKRKQVDAHLHECRECRELFAFVSTAHRVVTRAAHTKPQPEHHSRLTSNIMQAVNQQQNQKSIGLNSLFVRYAMVAASLSLVVLFGTEQLRSHEFNKRTPVARAVVLESTSISQIFLKGKEKSENRLSLYACAKTGDCDNVFIKNLVKKSF